jgi:hypothetical protein
MTSSSAKSVGHWDLVGQGGHIGTVPWTISGGRTPRPTVTYVSPFVPALFGDPNAWLPTGSDSLATSVNQFTNGGNTDTATLGGGSITYQTPTVPEPDSLAPLSTGVLGLASVIRRKLL